MSTSGSSARSERKRSQILAAARSVFAREGFAHAGMEEVARLAGVSTATLYAHFPGKSDLFETVVEDIVGDLAGRVADNAATAGDARERLTIYGQAYARFYLDPTSRAVFRMVIAERRRFPALAERFRDRGRVELGGSLLALIDELVEAGEIVVPKPSWAAGQLQGMIEHATLILGLVGGDEAIPARSADAIVAEAVETFLARYGVREKAA
ncbi:MAG: TetR/AcrR family transcriptional regulator C-terminal domain-containing protein [Pseudomonadota bacterium]